MKKEEILQTIAYQIRLDSKCFYEEDVLKCMDEYAENISIAFGNWLKNTVFEGDMPALYGYFINNIYNK